MWSDRAISTLLDCPEPALPFASTAYSVGVSDGADDVLRRLGEAGEDVRAAGGDVLRRPTFAELTERRKFVHDPCQRRCRTCSRCIGYEAWWRRGQRDYLGAEREAELSNALDSSRLEVLTALDSRRGAA